MTPAQTGCPMEPKSEVPVSAAEPAPASRWPGGRALPAGLVLVLSLLVTDAWLGYSTIRGLNDRAARVDQSHQVLDAASRLRDIVQEAVIGANRYVVTGDMDHLEPYLAIRPQVGEHVDQLTKLTQDNVLQRERASRIKQRITERVAFTDRIIRVRREEGYEAARSLLAKEFTKEQLSDLRQLFNEMTTAEEATLGVREEMARSSFRSATASTILTALIGLIVVSIAAWLTRRDLLLQQQSDSRLRESEARFRTVVESAVDGIIVIDSRGIVQSLNPAAVRLFGYPSGEVAGKNVSMLMPAPDCDRHDGYINGYLTTRQAKIIGHGRDVRGKRADGSTFPMHLSVSEASLAGERVFIGITTDISEQKRSEERLSLLVGELRHRVKNLIAIVQSIMSRTLVDGRGIAEARDIVVGRLLALGRAHDLLLKTNWQGAPLQRIVEAQMEGFSDRLRVGGPEVLLNASATQTFALALHELATNAAKYGALSGPDGHVEVRWSLVGDPAEPRLSFKWLERGGGPAVAPKHRGFGLTMLNDAMMSDFEKPPQLRFTPDGFEYEVDAPLAVVVVHEVPDNGIMQP